MKRFCSFVILILSIFVFSACGEDPIVSFASDMITINMGQVYRINPNDVKIENSKENFELLSLNELVAIVDEDKIIPVSEGVTFLRIQIEGGEYYCDVKLKVTNNISATSATIENTQVKIDINQTNTFENKLTLNTGCNEVPNVIISKDIITYDYLTGVITAKGTGTATVQINFVYCSVTFVVTVTGTIYTQQVNVFNFSTYEGAEGVFVSSIYPEYANTFYYTSDADNITVYSNGLYRAKSAGKATVELNYRTDKNTLLTKTFEVTILSKDTDFKAIILDENNQVPNTIYKERKYKLQVTGIDNVDTKKLVINDGITIITERVVGDVFEFDFYFNNTGNIVLPIIFKMDNVVVAEKTFSFVVETLENFTIKARWGTNSLVTDKEGKYHIYINTPGGISYIQFSLYFNNQKLSDAEYKFMDISSGVGIETSAKFAPTIEGEYILQFVVGEDIVKTIYVVVS